MTMRKRKSRARSSVRRKIGKISAKTHRKIVVKLNQAKRAEKLALKKLGLIARQNKLMVEKMRKTIKAKVAEKAKQAAKFRKQLAKKYAAQLRKLRREHAVAIKKLRNMIWGGLSQAKGKRKTVSKRRKTKSKSFARQQMARRRKAPRGKFVASRRRRASRARARRAA